MAEFDSRHFLPAVESMPGNAFTVPLFAMNENCSTANHALFAQISNNSADKNGASQPYSIRPTAAVA